MKEELRGTGVAVVTPFTRSKEIDYPALTNILDHIIEGGVEYVVIMGTTGESATLSTGEKKKLVEKAKEVVAGRVPFVLGIGGNNTAEVADEIKKTDFNGVDAILSVSPYYNKPSQKGIYYHYRELAETAPRPIILYNVPGRTGCNITAETTLRLAHNFENIIAVKEASGDFEQCMEIIKNRPDGFLVISGDDLFTLPYLAMGMDGVISVLANACPREFSGMVRTALKGDISTARKHHYELFDIIRKIYQEGSPAGIKALLEIKGFCVNELRLPMYPVSDGLYHKLGEYK